MLDLEVEYRAIKKMKEDLSHPYQVRVVGSLMLEEIIELITHNIELI